LAQLAGASSPDGPLTGGDRPAWAHAIPAVVPCIGRDADVAALVAPLLAGRGHPIPVTGGPGIGKTTIIRAAMHDRAVVDRFHGRRLFVRCDGIADADGIVLEIAAAIGVSVGPSLLFRVRAELTMEPALVVLDNIGPTWETDSTAVEDLVTSLAESGVATVVVSLRGTTLPFGTDRLAAVNVRRLDHTSARAVFVHYAGGAYHDDPYLDEIVASQDGVPLGVRLMAYAAQGEPNLAALWRRWAGRDPSSPVDGSYTRMDDCIAVSVASSRMNPAALRLLCMLGRLPDGVAHDDLDALLPGIGEFASSDLRRLGLAFEDQGRLRTLRPIREYVARAHPLVDSDAATVITHYSGLAERLGALIGTAEGARASARLVAEAGNVEAALADGLKQDDPAPAIHGVFGLAEFMRYTGLSRSRLLEAAADAANRHDLSELEAESRYRLGDIALRQCRLDEAAGHLQQAMDLFTDIGLQSGAARSVKHLGDVAFEQGNYEVAAEQFSRAEARYAENDDIIGAAHCIKCLGDVAARRGDVGLARDAYQRAIAYFEENDSLVGRADCLRRLADLDMTVADYDSADAGYDRAALLYESSGLVLGQANCLLGRARTAAARAVSGEAVDLAQRAQILYERMAYTRGEAACITLLGEVALRNGERAGALEHLSCARSLYEGIGDTGGEASVCELLATASANPIDASQYARDAVVLYQSAHDDEGVVRASAIAERMTTDSV
jgi:tetratricopeptide (TPR) repeat protein